MAGQYDNRERFIERMQPIIDRQVEIYREDPAAYIQRLPGRMHMRFTEKFPSVKIGMASLLASCLIATHRCPTAEYMWKLMNDDPARDDPFGLPWQADDDEGLTSLMS